MPSQLSSIQEELGLVSIKGNTLGSQSIAFPQRTKSISGPAPVKTEREKREEIDKGLTLQELITQIKTEKEADKDKKEKDVGE